MNKNKPLSYFNELMGVIQTVEHVCKIDFIRHAKTELNKNRIVQGGDITRDQTIYPLNKEDTNNILSKLRVFNKDAIKHDRIYISPALRTEETANLLTSQSKTIIKELDEINWGLIDGTKQDEKYFELNKTWLELQTNWSVRFKGGESLDAFIRRLILAISKICKDIVKYKYTSVLIVGHGFFFGILFGLLFNREVSLKYKLENLEHRQILIGHLLTNY